MGHAETYLIATNMQIRIGKHLSHLGQERSHELVGVVRDGVHGIALAIGLASGVARSQQLRIAQAPRLRMTWRIELGNHSHSSHPSVRDHLLHLRFAVDMSRVIRPHLAQQRPLVRHERERLVVDNVPMQHVELVVRQRVDLLQKNRQGQIVARRIDQISAMLESWCIDDRGLGNTPCSNTSYNHNSHGNGSGNGNVRINIETHTERERESV
jgi:hypothetical protein